MPTAEKAEKVDSLARQLQESKGTVLLDYRGLSVAEITALRRQLKADGVDFHVAKNTLLKLAAKQAGVPIPDNLLEGPTAIALGWDDEVKPAKLLSEYARRNRVVEIKGGVIAGESFEAAQINRLATLPSREALLAQLVGLMQAPLTQTLSMVQAPPRQMLGLATALESQKAEAAA